MNIDDEIKNVLNKKAINISPSDAMFGSIKNSVEKENIYMRKGFTAKKMIALCAAICAIGAVTVIGSGKVVSMTAHSSRLDDIKHFPTQAELGKIIDYSPKYVEKLGKYDFDFANPGESEEKDANGNVLYKYRDMSFWYKTDEGILSLNTKPVTQDIDDDKSGEPIEYNGKTLYYSSIKYKFVPPGYELTQEDKELMDKKELEVSYGSQEIELKDNASIVWDDGDVSYCLLDMDAHVPKDELIAMAKQVIDSDRK